MLRVFLLLFLFSLALTCPAQDLDPEIDSLKGVLASQQVDSLKVNTLIEIGTQYLSTDIEEALNYGTQARDLAEKVNFKMGLGVCTEATGYCECYQRGLS